MPKKVQQVMWWFRIFCYTQFPYIRSILTSCLKIAKDDKSFPQVAGKEIRMELASRRLRERKSAWNWRPAGYRKEKHDNNKHTTD
jgi:hypothetical protein